MGILCIPQLANRPQDAMPGQANNRLPMVFAPVPCGLLCLDEVSHLQQPEKEKGYRDSPTHAPGCLFFFPFLSSCFGDLRAVPPGTEHKLGKAPVFAKHNSCLVGATWGSCKCLCSWCHAEVPVLQQGRAWPGQAFRQHCWFRLTTRCPRLSRWQSGNAYNNARFLSRIGKSSHSLDLVYFFGLLPTLIFLSFSLTYHNQDDRFSSSP